MLAKDLMRTKVLSVRDDDSVGDLVDFLISEHIHGAPVLDADGALVGIVSQQDVYFSSMTHARDGQPEGALKVRDIMTSPPMTVREDVEIRQLCELMYRLRIHRVPVVRDGEVVGIISSLDVCAAISQGKNLE